MTHPPAGPSNPPPPPGPGRELVTFRYDGEKDSVRLADGTPGNPNKAIVNEPGLCSLILRSDKPEAKAFKR